MPVANHLIWYVCEQPFTTRGRVNTQCLNTSRERDSCDFHGRPSCTCTHTFRPPPGHDAFRGSSNYRMPYLSYVLAISGWQAVIVPTFCQGQGLEGGGNTSVFLYEIHQISNLLIIDYGTLEVDAEYWNCLQVDVDQSPLPPKPSQKSLTPKNNF
jgi:hypothetical protein